MELNKEQFDDLLKYYHLEFNNVLGILDSYVNMVGLDTLKGKQILVYVQPTVQYPPASAIGFNINVPDDIATRLGYFDMTKYIKHNLH